MKHKFDVLGAIGMICGIVLWLVFRDSQSATVVLLGAIASLQLAICDRLDSK